LLYFTTLQGYFIEELVGGTVTDSPKSYIAFR